jgi:hypothetical protein
MAIGIIIILYFLGILISLFSGVVDFSSVQEGRTSLHVGVFLISWAILIPISAKFTKHSFVFKWILIIEKIMFFGKTGFQYLAFNTALAALFGILFTLIGLGIIENV